MAFPLLTPWHLSNSSKVVGYNVAISCKEFSKKITKGGKVIFLASVCRKPLSISNSRSSAAAPTVASLSLSSSSAFSSNTLFNVMLKGVGFFKYFFPFAVTFSKPYSSISFSIICSSIA